MHVDTHNVFCQKYVFTLERNLEYMYIWFHYHIRLDFCNPAKFVTRWRA